MKHARIHGTKYNTYWSEKAITRAKEGHTF